MLSLQVTPNPSPVPSGMTVTAVPVDSRPGTTTPVPVAAAASAPSSQPLRSASPREASSHPGPSAGHVVAVTPGSNFVASSVIAVPALTINMSADAQLQARIKELEQQVLHLQLELDQERSHSAAFEKVQSELGLVHKELSDERAQRKAANARIAELEEELRATLTRLDIAEAELSNMRTALNRTTKALTSAEKSLARFELRQWTSAVVEATWTYLAGSSLRRIDLFQACDSVGITSLLTLERNREALAAEWVKTGISWDLGKVYDNLKQLQARGGAGVVSMLSRFKTECDVASIVERPTYTEVEFREVAEAVRMDSADAAKLWAIHRLTDGTPYLTE